MLNFCRITIISFLLILDITQSNAQINYNDTDVDRLAQTESAAFGKMNLTAHTRYSPTTDITYARIKMFLRGNKDTIGASVTFVYKVLEPIDSILFNMDDKLNVDSVIYHGAYSNYHHGRSILGILFGGTISRGIIDTISIFYHGNPETNNGFGSFLTGVHGTSNDSVVWTLSEPYGAQFWWPCKNDLSDKIDSCDIYVETPVKYIASANGAIVSQNTDGKLNYLHFKLHYPVATYLIGIAASNYVYFDTTMQLLHSKVLFTHAVYPENVKYFYSSQLQIGQALYLYDSLFGAYPFAKDRFGVTQFGWGGGMEHESNVFVHDDGYELNVHEMAHQWFGDKITLGSWQDIWLNEGWAVYCSYLCYQYRQNGYWWPIAKKDMIHKIIAQPNGSVWCSDTTSVARIFDSRLTYRKGAALLHMLRWELGDSLFFIGTLNYILDTALCYKFARTQQFKQHLESASGISLDTFFNQWFYGQGYPTYRINHSQIGTSVTLQIKQTTSDTSVSAYHMHLPVLLKSTTGKDTLLRLWNTDTMSTYVIDHVGFKVDSVLFDPQWWIVAGNHSLSPTYIKSLANKEEVLNIYPNPASHTISVSNTTGLRSVEFTDMLGRVYLRSLNLDNNFVQMDISQYPHGIYFIRARTQLGNLITKTVVKP